MTTKNTPTTEAEARALVDALCTYLTDSPIIGDWGDDDEPDSDLDERTEERKSAGFARESCHRLLKASKSNGLGGCRLCVS